MNNNEIENVIGSRIVSIDWINFGDSVVITLDSGDTIYFASSNSGIYMELNSEYLGGV